MFPDARLILDSNQGDRRVPSRGLRLFSIRPDFSPPTWTKHATGPPARERIRSKVTRVATLQYQWYKGYQRALEIAVRRIYRELTVGLP
jgi:hypothetical protein